MLHRDHIKLEGAWEPKIGVKLCATILSKLQCKLFLSRPFSVCSYTSRSDNWSLRNCFVLVFINCRAEKLLSWVLVGHYFCLHCFTLFFGVFWEEKKKKWDKNEVTFDSDLELIIRACLFCSPIDPIWRSSIFTLAVEWHLTTNPHSS